MGWITEGCRFVSLSGLLACPSFGRADWHHLWRAPKRCRLTMQAEVISMPFRWMSFQRQLSVDFEPPCLKGDKEELLALVDKGHECCRTQRKMQKTCTMFIWGNGAQYSRKMERTCFWGGGFAKCVCDICTLVCTQDSLRGIAAVVGLQQDLVKLVGNSSLPSSSLQNFPAPKGCVCPRNLKQPGTFLLH